MDVEGKLAKLEPMTIYTGMPMPFTPPPDGALGNNVYLFGNCALSLAYDQSARKGRATLIPGCPPYIMDLHDRTLADAAETGGHH
jgi:hypothetical protein